MILTASFWSLTLPMCQPPRQKMETLTPVLPRGRVGRPSRPASHPAVSARDGAPPAGAAGGGVAVAGAWQGGKELGCAARAPGRARCDGGEETGEVWDPQGRK